MICNSPAYNVTYSALIYNYENIIQILLINIYYTYCENKSVNISNITIRFKKECILYLYTKTIIISVIRRKKKNVHE